MSNPRATLDFTGISQDRETFNIDNSTITFDRTKAGGSASVGLAVMISAAATVALTNDAARVLGRLELVEPDGKCTVTVGGCVKLPAGNGATTTPGKAIVGALGASSARGYIRDVDLTVLAEVGKCDGEILDDTDETNVVILLD